MYIQDKKMYIQDKKMCIQDKKMFIQDKKMYIQDKKMDSQDSNVVNRDITIKWSQIENPYYYFYNNHTCYDQLLWGWVEQLISLSRDVSIPLL